MKTDQEWAAELSKPGANWIEIIRNIQSESYQAGLDNGYQAGFNAATTHCGDSDD